MIKAVLFDYGGVLAESGKFGGTAKIPAKLYGLDETHADLRKPQRVFLNTLKALDNFIAVLSRKFPHLARSIGRKIFFRIAPGFIRHDRMYAFAAELRAAGLRTGILSNVFAVLADEHKRRGDYKNFAPVLLSCEAGLAKPDKRFYEMALDALQLQAHEILFIDDKKSGLIPARHLGMHTILAKSSEQVVDDVNKLLREINDLNLRTFNPLQAGTGN